VADHGHADLRQRERGPCLSLLGQEHPRWRLVVSRPGWVRALHRRRRQPLRRRRLGGCASLGEPVWQSGMGGQHQHAQMAPGPLLPAGGERPLVSFPARPTDT
jgi:hypothetical protein